MTDIRICLSCSSSHRSDKWSTGKPNALKTAICHPLVSRHPLEQKSDKSWKAQAEQDKHTVYSELHVTYSTVDDRKRPRSEPHRG
jgi:hypothetical protein